MRKLDDRAFSNLVPLVLAVIIGFALLFAGSYITGTIHTELEDSFGASPTTVETKYVGTMNNISYNLDSTIDIVQVTIIITILAGAIGAIFLFTRFR